MQNKKIAILGLGIENLFLIRYLLKHKIKCKITVCDKRNDVNRSGLAKAKINWQLGRDYNKNLDKFDILFRAPGWPMNEIKSKKSKVKSINSPIRLFFELCPTKNIIGVTGAKGKGTTASLIYEILKTAGKRVWLGGNIGVAPFEFMDKIKKNDWVILELSSFQLEDFTVSPRIAVMTNFYPEHLAPADPHNQNYHQSMNDYFKAKANIFRWQKKGDYAIFNFQFSVFKQTPIFNFQTKGKKIYFKKSELPSRLIGEHNKENVAAAVEVAKLAGAKPAIIRKAVANFKGLEHRLELAREFNGVKYYDDSFATTPEAALTALKAFNAPIVLFLGGADKDSDFSELVKEVKRRTKFVLLLSGKATARIKKELLKAGYEKNKIKLFDKIDEAVKYARQLAVPGDVVLLSTACASFGLFKNYKERGKLFKAAVKKLVS